MLFVTVHDELKALYLTIETPLFCSTQVGIAHVVHVVREVNGRSELRSRIYLGDFNKVDDNSILPLWCINSIGNR